jgi:hypothetical protein
LYLKLIAERRVLETLLKRGHGGNLLVEYLVIEDIIKDIIEILGVKIS